MGETKGATCMSCNESIWSGDHTKCKELIDAYFAQFDEPRRKMNVKEKFQLEVNEDAKRFEFTAQVEGITSYLVSFDEVDGDSERAWSAVEAALSRKGGRDGNS
jgi:hypothetical protein